MTVIKLEVVANGIQKETILLRTRRPADIEVIDGNKTLYPGDYDFTLKGLKAWAQHRAKKFYGEKTRIKLRSY